MRNLTIATVRRVNTLTAAFVAARKACMDAFHAGNTATADVPDGSDESVYAAARVAAGVPPIETENALRDAMVTARAALATELRAAMVAAGLKVPTASDWMVVEKHVALSV